MLIIRLVSFVYFIISSVIIFIYRLRVFIHQFPGFLRLLFQFFNIFSSLGRCIVILCLAVLLIYRRIFVCHPGINYPGFIVYHSLSVSQFCLCNHILQFFSCFFQCSIGNLKNNVTFFHFIPHRKIAFLHIQSCLKKIQVPGLLQHPDCRQAACADNAFPQAVHGRGHIRMSFIFFKPSKKKNRSTCCNDNHACCPQDNHPFLAGFSLFFCRPFLFHQKFHSFLTLLHFCIAFCYS